MLKSIYMHICIKFCNKVFPQKMPK